MITQDAMGRLCLLGLSLILSSTMSKVSTENFYSFTVANADGENMNLAKYEGRVVMVVNVASKCGFTDSQYKDLVQLHKEYANKPFDILAFPSNQFGKQEPGTNSEVCTFAKTSYNVTFPILSKVDVKGSNAVPLYKWLAKETGRSPMWNFSKYLVDTKGHAVTHYGCFYSPLSMKGDIDKLLAGAPAGPIPAEREEL